MDIQAYIESGILESYVLGVCSKEESLEVERLCALYPEVKAELDQISQAIFKYASTHSKTPKVETKQKIFDEIDQLSKPLAATQTIPFSPNRYRFAVAASLALFALSVIGNIIIYNKYQSVQDELISLNSEKIQLAETLKSQQVKFEEVNQEMAILTDPKVQRITLKGVEKSPESLTMVYWNQASKEVFVEIKSLPIPEPGKQYQLWAIVDGKPVDAGMITMGDSILHKMKNFESVQAFAITLEQEGGSPTPSLSEMYVMGAVSL